MDPSDSQHGRMTVMFSNHPLVSKQPPRWISQVPRLIFPHALSPTTPGGPMAASTRFFTTGSGLHHSQEGWPHSNCVTRPNRVHLRYGSRVRSAGLRPFGLLRGPPAPLPVERVINRVTTVQTTRSDRLSLAHRRNRTQEMHPKSSSKCQGLFPFPGGIIFQLLKSWQQRYHRRRNR